MWTGWMKDTRNAHSWQRETQSVTNIAQAGLEAISVFHH